VTQHTSQMESALRIVAQLQQFSFRAGARKSTHRPCNSPCLRETHLGGHGSLAEECSTLLKAEAVQALGPPRSPPVLLRITAW
jgi:hypothetical protein